MCSNVAIFHAVTDPGRAHKPVQLVAVRMNERVVLLDHELGVAAIGGEVLDRASELGGVCGPKAGRADRAVFGEGAQDLDQVGVLSRPSEPRRCYGSLRCPRRRCGDGPLSVVRRRKVFS